MKGDFRIGPWLVEPTLNRISRNGASRHLEPKVMQVLACLSKADGQVVSKQQLIEEVWKSTFVTDDVLTRSISELRDGFGDDARDPKIIQTIPKRGYRLLLAATSLTEPPPATHDRRGIRLLGWAGVIVALVAIASGVALRYVRRNPVTTSALKITRLTHSGKATAAEASPDGKSFFYIKNENGQFSIRLRQISTGSEVVVLAAGERGLFSLTISPNGDYLYFTQSHAVPTKAAQPTISNFDLYVMPALGGTPRKIAENVQSSVVVSPDGNRIAFLRAHTREAAWDVVIANADGTNEQVAHRRHEPRYYGWSMRMSWSPDGRSIAVPAREDRARKGDLAIIDVISGTERMIPAQPWEGAIGDCAWLPDGSGVVLTGVVDGSWQLWFVNAVTQTAHRISRDTADYYSPSLFRNGQDILTEQHQSGMTIWTADYSAPMHARQVSFSPRALDGLTGLSWTADSKILYTSFEGGNEDIWQLDPLLGAKQQVTTDPARDRRPQASADGRYIVFVKWDDQIHDIWRMDADGRNRVPLTRGDTNVLPRVSPNGKWFVFGSSRHGKRRVWKMPVAGGVAVMAADISADLAFFSPDGRWIALYSTEGASPQTVIVNAETGAQVRTIEGKHAAFTPDAKGLLFLDDYQGVRNIMVRPLSGRKPYPLTKFKENGIWDFAVSPDGKKLALVRREEETDIVLISGFRNGGTP